MDKSSDLTGEGRVADPLDGEKFSDFPDQDGLQSRGKQEAALWGTSKPHPGEVHRVQEKAISIMELKINGLQDVFFFSM